MSASPASSKEREPRRTALIILSWAWVTIPFGYGVYELVLKAKQLFTQ
jgi:hypothetical protein